MLLVALWALLSLVVAIWARSRGRNAIAWLLVSAVLSPPVGFALLAITKNQAKEPEPRQRTRLRDRVKNSRTYRFVRNTLIALALAFFVMVVLNRIGMKPVAIAGVDVAESLWQVS